MATTDRGEDRERPSVNIRGLATQARQLAALLETFGLSCEETGLLSEVRAVSLALTLKEFSEDLANRVEESWNNGTEVRDC